MNTDFIVDSGNDPGYIKLAAVMPQFIKREVKKLDCGTCGSKSLMKQWENAVIAKPETLAMLPDSDFALIIKEKDGDVVRKFPCHTEDDTAVSMIYLLANKDTLPPKARAIAAQRLLDAFGDSSVGPTWEIRDIVTEYKKEVPQGNVYNENEFGYYDSNIEDVLPSPEETKKTAAANYVFLDKNGRGMFDISTKENWDKVAQYFIENHAAYELDHRHMFAKKLRDKAAELSITPEAPSISKYASYCWSPCVEEEVASRVALLEKYDVIEKTASYAGDGDEVIALIGYKKLLKYANDKSMNIDVFASTLRKLDAASGVEDFYGKGVTNAYEATYSKVASLSGFTRRGSEEKTTFSGKEITVSDILSLRAEDLIGMFDSGTLDELKSDPIQVFSTLPIPYKSAVLDALGK